MLCEYTWVRSLRPSVLIPTLVALLVLSGPFATPAAAQCAPNAGPFCIDGTITDTNNSGYQGGAVKNSDPNGNVQELGPDQGATTKLNQVHLEQPPMLDLEAQAPKTDLNTVYTQGALDGSGALWFYFGWIRDAAQGSGFIAVEFQKAAKPAVCNYDTQTSAQLIANCNPWANRAEDDFMILWDQNGGSRNVYVRYFENGSFGPFILLTADVAVAQYNSAGDRGEMAINFSAVVGVPPNQCITFANIIPNTLTGNSPQDTADYKDTVLKNFPILTNCGTVTVKKVTDSVVIEGSNSFQYTIAGSGSIFGAVTADPDCEVSGGGSLNQCIGLLAKDETDSITDVLADSDYTLVESDIPSLFQLASIICTVDANGDGDTADAGESFTITNGGAFTVVATKTTNCVISNALRPGYLSVIKIVVNGFGLNSQPGAFQYQVDALASRYFTNTGAQNGTSCASGAVCFTYTFNPGTTHNVVELNPPAGYDVSYNNCTSLTIAPGATQTCTITNTALQNTVAATTQQRVLLFDRGKVTGVRRTSGDDNTMLLIFRVYADSTACNAQSGPLATETVALTFASSSATDSNQVGTTGTPAVEIQHPTNGSTLGPVNRYWRATFQQSGASPANAAFTTPCNEVTTVTLSQ